MTVPDSPAYREITYPGLPEDLIVGTMCHCEDPYECDGHWEFYISAMFGHDGEHVRIGRRLEAEVSMRAIAALVADFNAGHLRYARSDIS